MPDSGSPLALTLQHNISNGREHRQSYSVRSLLPKWVRTQIDGFLIPVNDNSIGIPNLRFRQGHWKFRKGSIVPAVAGFTACSCS